MQNTLRQEVDGTVVIYSASGLEFNWNDSTPESIEVYSHENASVVGYISQGEYVVRAHGDEVTVESSEGLFSPQVFTVSDWDTIESRIVTE